MGHVIYLSGLINIQIVAFDYLRKHCHTQRAQFQLLLLHSRSDFALFYKITTNEWKKQQACLIVFPECSDSLSKITTYERRNKIMDYNFVSVKCCYMIL